MCDDHSKVRVLHVVNLFPTEKHPANGVFVKEQIESLSDDVKCDIYFINKKERGYKEYIRGIYNIWQLKSEYDVIHAHQLLSGLACVLAGCRSKLIVSILSSGNDLIGWWKWFGDLIFKIVARFSRLLIFKCKVPSEYKDKSVYIPNGVDENTFNIKISQLDAKRELGLDESVKYVLFVSSNNLHRPEKRYDFFLEVIEELKVKKPSIKIDGLAISNISREKIPLYYSAASVHLLTSEVEGSPNSVKESLASGCPVVARDVGDIQLLIGNVPGCDLFHDYDVSAVAESIINSVRRRNKKNIRAAFIKKKITRLHIRDRLLKVYTEFCR